MKKKINMVGGGFQHDICSSAGSTPKLIEWVKFNHTAPISIHIDHAIIKQSVNKNKKNYAWLSESKTINRGLYENCLRNISYLEDNFELIFATALPHGQEHCLPFCGYRIHRQHRPGNRWQPLPG